MLFSLVFKPLIRPGGDVVSGIAALQKRFELTPAQLNTLFRSPSKAIKTGLSEQQAKALMRLFWGLGWHSEIQCEGQTVYSTLSNRKPSRSEQQTVVTSQLESLEFPTGWGRFESLNPKASIQAGNDQGQAFCIVIPQTKSDFHQAPSHYSYSQAVLKSAVSQSVNCEILHSCQPKFAETSGWPLSLSEFILWDLSNGTHYLLAVYEGRESFYSIYCWAGCGDFARFRNDFLFVIDSFRLHDHAGSFDRASTKHKTALAAPVS